MIPNPLQPLNKGLIDELVDDRKGLVHGQTDDI